MRDTVLIVDDVEINRAILSGVLEEEYKILEADNGYAAIQQINEHHNEIAVILLDLIMPEVDGFVVLRVLQEKEISSRIPVLVISGENTVDVETQCFGLGVADFVGKPFEPGKVRNRVNNAVELFSYKNELEAKVKKQTETLNRQYLMLKEQSAKLKAQADELKENNNNIIGILGTVVEYRNTESGNHINRVKGFTRILAESVMRKYAEYELTKEKIDVIVSASALHDIGKVAIPDNILMKPGKLTENEYSFMKSHTTMGCDILNNIKGAWDEEYGRVSYEICRYHHERYDGKGYPEGLVGDDIPISAQIVSIADVYDALVSERVYKSAYSKEEAFFMILRGECGVFSPKLLECFKEVRQQFEMLADEYREKDVEQWQVF